MPSQSVLEKKIAAVDALADKFGKASAGVLVRYQGITVEDDTKLRAAMRAAGVEYTVLKNSLIGRACEKVGFDDMKKHLEGMNAIAITEGDQVAPAKILKEYADKIESFELVSGFLDGKVVDGATVTELASIPAKEILLARMLGSLTGPIQSLAIGLQAVIDKGGEAAPAEAAPAEEAPAEAPVEEAPAEAAPAEEAPAAE